jgi:hypothetical protein
VASSPIVIFPTRPADAYPSTYFIFCHRADQVMAPPDEGDQAMASFRVPAIQGLKLCAVTAKGKNWGGYPPLPLISVPGGTPPIATPPTRPAHAYPSPPHHHQAEPGKAKRRIPRAPYPSRSFKAEGLLRFHPVRRHNQKQYWRRCLTITFDPDPAPTGSP